MRAVSRTHRRARDLRGKMTLPEVLLWVRLRQRSPGGPAFRRQHPIGRYVLDFYCAEARLCIEVDGESHLMGSRPERDQTRDNYLRAVGIEVVRYAATEILRDVDDIAASIRCAAAERTALPTRS